MCRYDFTLQWECSHKFFDFFLCTINSLTIFYGFRSQTFAASLNKDATKQTLTSRQTKFQIIWPPKFRLGINILSSLLTINLEWRNLSIFASIGLCFWIVYFFHNQNQIKVFKVWQSCLNMSISKFKVKFQNLYFIYIYWLGPWLQGPNQIPPQCSFFGYVPLH